MKKSIRHSGVLMMLGVFAIALMGSAYTLWYEDLTLEAEIETGELNLDWSIDGDIDGSGGTPVVAILDEGDTNLEFAPEGEESNGTTVPANKLPECDATIDGDEGAANGDSGDYNVLDLDLTGLYPYAGCEFDINITNSGDVPAHLWLGDFTGDADGQAEITWELVSDQSDEGFEYCTELLDQIFAGTEGQLVGENDDPIQLHNEDTIRCEVVYYLKQTNEGGETTVENFDGSFGYTIKGHQWNETPNDN